MTRQIMKRPQVFLVEPLPFLAVNGRPKVARQAANEVLTAIINFDERLLAMVAAFHSSQEAPASSFGKWRSPQRGAAQCRECC